MFSAEVFEIKSIVTFLQKNIVGMKDQYAASS